MIMKLDAFYGVGHSRTTPYHRQGNGVVERFNLSLLALLRHLVEIKKSRRDDVLKKNNKSITMH